MHCPNNLAIRFVYSETPPPKHPILPLPHTHTHTHTPRVTLLNYRSPPTTAPSVYEFTPARVFHIENTATPHHHHSHSALASHIAVRLRGVLSTHLPHPTPPPNLPIPIVTLSFVFFCERQTLMPPPIPPHPFSPIPHPTPPHPPSQNQAVRANYSQPLPLPYPCPTPPSRHVIFACPSLFTTSLFYLPSPIPWGCFFCRSLVSSDIHLHRPPPPLPHPLS